MFSLVNRRYNCTQTNPLLCQPILFIALGGTVRKVSSLFLGVFIFQFEFEIKITRK